MNKVLLTGVTGFIGGALARRLLDDGYFVVGAVRNENQYVFRGSNEINQSQFECQCVGDINGKTSWADVLKNVDIVVHLAARVHVMGSAEVNSIDVFRQINLHGTMELARQAANNNIKRFVYISSIKVNGESTLEKKYTSEDVPSPVDPYGISKAEAEQQLFNFSKKTGMEVVVIRPPLVYGPGVGGNFLRLLQLVKCGVPLPLASINNKRSMVSLTNLCDLIVCCISHPEASGEVFLVSDGEDQSTPELILHMSECMMLSNRLFPFPVSLLNVLGHTFGRETQIERLCNSLQVDIKKTCDILDWVPSETLAQGLRDTIEWFGRYRND